MKKAPAYRQAGRHLLPGHLTVSAAWQESLLIRRDATLIVPHVKHGAGLPQRTS